MVVKKVDDERVMFQDLDFKDGFVYKDELFVKINMREVLCMNTCKVTWFIPQTIVNPVDITITYKER